MRSSPTLLLWLCALTLCTQACTPSVRGLLQQNKVSDACYQVKTKQERIDFKKHIFANLRFNLHWRALSHQETTALLGAPVNKSKHRILWVLRLGQIQSPYLKDRNYASDLLPQMQLRSGPGWKTYLSQEALKKYFMAQTRIAVKHWFDANKKLQWSASNPLGTRIAKNLHSLYTGAKKFKQGAAAFVDGFTQFGSDFFKAISFGIVRLESTRWFRRRASTKEKPKRFVFIPELTQSGRGEIIMKRHAPNKRSWKQETKVFFFHVRSTQAKASPLTAQIRLLYNGYGRCKTQSKPWTMTLNQNLFSVTPSKRRKLRGTLAFKVHQGKLIEMSKKPRVAGLRLIPNSPARQHRDCYLLDKESCFSLGRSYQTSRQAKRQKQARDYLHIACSLYHKKACISLLQWYRNHKVSDSYRKNKVRLIACSLGHAESCKRWVHLQHKESPTGYYTDDLSFSRTVYQSRTACAAQDALSCKFLGKVLDKERRRRMALQAYTLGCLYKDGWSCYQIAEAARRLNTSYLKQERFKYLQYKQACRYQYKKACQKLKAKDWKTHLCKLGDKRLCP